MKIADSISLVQDCLADARGKKKTVGLVMTMGWLHEGHCTLIRKAKAENDFVVVSIFVNPTQFGPGEDFGKYPRDQARDEDILTKEGVDLLFAPTEEEIFKHRRTFVQVEGMDGKLCGQARPGHFRGVATVVLKVFNIIGPKVAYFGKKDYQQFLMVRNMVEDLNLKVEIKGVETVREPDGLAVSSRNLYLSEEDRSLASFIPKGVQLAKDLVNRGERNTIRIEESVRTMFLEKGLQVQYVQICSSETLEPEKQVQKHSRIFLALQLGDTRLIDNQLLEAS
ncbi:MAG: pantoate--beta-alanine ligase [Nitrospinota bacterium]